MKTKRYKELYTKPIPKDSEVILHVRYKIDRCPDCGNELVRQKEYDKYIEDFERLYERS
jgi:uncharacterized C2H2 Zn-finger protein